MSNVNFLKPNKESEGVERKAGKERWGRVHIGRNYPFHKLQPPRCRVLEEGES